MVCRSDCGRCLQVQGAASAWKWEPAHVTLPMYTLAMCEPYSTWRVRRDGAYVMPTIVSLACRPPRRGMRGGICRDMQATCLCDASRCTQIRVLVMISEYLIVPGMQVNTSWYAGCVQPAWEKTSPPALVVQGTEHATRSLRRCKCETEQEMQIANDFASC